MGGLGISLDFVFSYPYMNSAEDMGAAERANEFTLAWFADPLTRGEYPPLMREYIGERLPHFSDKEKESLIGSLDFMGLNVYTARYASDNMETIEPGMEDPTSDMHATFSQTSVNGELLGIQTDSAWLYLVPSAMYSCVMWAHHRYGGRVPFIVTENGMSDSGDPGISMADSMCDSLRVTYYELYLKGLARAIRAGANVGGYYAWTLMDNWEWGSGFTERFGLHYIDFNSSLQARYKKASAYWWTRFLTKWLTV
eukprot:TRINITY_DN20427_c0_g2_i2.p1 TRINITY_DN20427_c0_g2~~TRINITY_DN20427_c0_g2_i2.p1  ORF type:complete len:254 (+),score=1.63 TRINITY_DN20427_c0_g2_i2:82-843(+)